MASKKSPQRNVSKSKVGGKRPEVLLDESIIASVPGTEASKASRATLKKPRVDEQQAEVVASTEGAQAEVVDLSDVVPLVADVALAPVPAATSLESLLVQVATADAKSDKDSGVSPWWLVAGGAGIAALAAGGGGGGDSSPATPPPAAPPAPQGFVVDALVKNVVVFRDSDGDGMWKDVNGDGVWQQGDEFITVTNENGSFDNLAGTGGFVAASLRVLMSTNGADGDARTTVRFTTDSVITGSNGERITGEAIDTGTNQPFTGFFLANDIKLAGPAGSSVYITGVSTLVAQMLADVAAPTTEQLLAAAQKVAVMLNVPFTGTFDSADAIALFTGEQNTELASVLASVAASARAVDLGMTDQEAVINFLAKLADTAEAGGIRQQGMVRSLDLTSQADLAIVFNEVLQEVVDAAAAEALADTFAQSAIGAPAAAQQAVYFIAPFANDSDQVFVSEDVMVGHLSVLAAGTSADISVSTSSEVSVEVVSGSNLRVEASGFSAEADLVLANVVGEVGDITVQATGDDSSAFAGAALAGSVGGDVTVAATGSDAVADLSLDIGGDLIGNLTVKASDASAGMTTIFADFKVQGSDAEASVDVAGSVSGDVMVLAEGLDSEASLLLDVGGSFTGDVIVDASGEGSSATAEGDIRGGSLSGDVTVTASGVYSYASLDLSISGDLTGDITVKAQGISGDLNVIAIPIGEFDPESGLLTLQDEANLSATDGLAVTELMVGVTTDVVVGVTTDVVVGMPGDDPFISDGADAQADVVIVGSLSGDVMVLAEGVSDQADIELTVGGDVKGNLTIQASGRDSFASLDVEISGSLSGDITAKATGSDASVELDAYISVDVNGEIEVEASGSDSSAETYVDVYGAVSGDVSVVASGANSYASLDLDISLDLTGKVTSEASGSDASAESHVEVQGAMTGDITVKATGGSSVASVDLDVDGSLSGDVTVTASGLTANGYLIGYVGGNVDGKVAVDASGTRSYVSVEIEVDGSMSGDVTVKASGDSADAYLSLDVSGDLDGKLTVEATGDLSEVSVEIEVDGSMSGDVTVTASGDSADAYLSLDVEGSVNGQLMVEASGDDSYVSVEIEVDGSLSGDVTVKTSGDSADVYMSVDVDGSVDGKLTVEAAGDDSDAYLAVAVRSDSLSGDITVKATGAGAFAGLYTYVCDDLDGAITVEASSSDGSAETYIEIFGSVSGDVSILASGSDSYASIDLNVSVDLTGKLTVEASGADAFAELNVDVLGSMSGDITAKATATGASVEADVYVGEEMNGKLTVDATGENSLASLEIDVDGSLSGDIAVTASGDSADAYLGLYVSNDLDGKLTVEAKGEGSEVSVEIEIDGSLSGDVTVTASADSADAYLSLDVSGDFTGKLTVEAKGEGSEASVEVEIDGSLSGDVTVTASGDSAETYLSLDVDGDLTGNVKVEAKGEGSEASVEVEIDGSLSGDVTVTASGDSAETYLSLDVDGDLTGNVKVEALNEGSEASLEMLLGGNLIGGITVDAKTDGLAEASVDISGDISGDLVVHAIGEGAVADLSLSYSGNLGGKIDFKAEDGGKVYLHDGEGNVLLNKNLDGLAVEVSGDATEVHLALTLVSSDVDGMILVSADDGASVADLTLEVNGQVLGAVSVVAQGDGAQASLDLEVIGEFVDRPGISSGSTIRVLEGGSIEGNVTVQASGEASSAQAEVTTDADIDGNVVVRADGLATGEVVEVPLERRARFSDSSADFNIADRDIDTIVKPVFDRALELNTAVEAMGSADNPGFAQAYISLDVGGDINGEILVSAVSDRASARLQGDVAGNLDRGLIVSGVGDRSAVYISLDVDGDIDVVSGTGTALYVFADGQDATVAVDLEVDRDIAGNVEVGVDGEGALAVVAVDVDGDIEGDVQITVTGDHAAAYVSLDVGNSIEGSIDIRVEGESAVADVYAEFSLDMSLQGTVTLDVSEASGTARFAVEQSVQGGDVSLNGQGRYEVRMVDGAILRSIDINTSGLVDLVLDGGGVSDDVVLITSVSGFSADTDVIRALIDPSISSANVDVSYGIAYGPSGPSADMLVAAANFSSDVNTDASFYITQVGADTFVVYDADGDEVADGILRLMNTSSADLSVSNFLYQQNLDIQGQADAQAFGEPVIQQVSAFSQLLLNDGGSVTVAGTGLVGGSTRGMAQYEETVNLGRVSISNDDLMQDVGLTGVQSAAGNVVNFDIALLEGGRVGDVSVLAVDHAERIGTEEVNVTIDGTTSNSAGSEFRQSNVNVLAQGGANASLEVTKVSGSIGSITVGATAPAAGITNTGGDARVLLKEAGSASLIFNPPSPASLQVETVRVGDIEVGAMQGVTGSMYALVVEDSVLNLQGDITVQAGGVGTLAALDLSSTFDRDAVELGGNLVTGSVGDVVVQAQDGGVATFLLGFDDQSGRSSVDSVLVSAGTAPVPMATEPTEFALADAVVATDRVDSVTVEAFDNARANLNLTVGDQDGASLTADVTVTGGADDMGVDDEAEVQLQFSRGLTKLDAAVPTLDSAPVPHAELSLSLLVSDLDRGIDLVDGKYQMSQVDLDLTGAGELSFGFIGSSSLEGSYGSADTFDSIGEFLMEADDALDGMVQMFSGQIGNDWYVALDQDGMGVSALITISSLQVWSPVCDVCQQP